MQEHYYDEVYQNEANHWWYRVRRSMVKEILSSFVHRHREPIKILDVGCGTGLLLSELQAFGLAEGIDMSPRAIEYCKQRGLKVALQGDATALPYPDASFDAVTILDVLEHIKDDRATCTEILRVLKPGGIVIVMVPAFMFLWGITDTLSQHFRRYTRKEIQGKLKETGFKVQRATYFNTLLFPMIALVRLTVRFLKIPVTSESQMGKSLGNFLFYQIFRLEPFLLRFINFPFGVSILLIAIKK